MSTVRPSRACCLSLIMRSPAVHQAARTTVRRGVRNKQRTHRQSNFLESSTTRQRKREVGGQRRPSHSSFRVVVEDHHASSFTAPVPKQGTCAEPPHVPTKPHTTYKKPSTSLPCRCRSSSSVLDAGVKPATERANFVPGTPKCSAAMASSSATVASPGTASTCAARFFLLACSTTTGRWFGYLTTRRRASVLRASSVVLARKLAMLSGDEERVSFFFCRV